MEEFEALNCVHLTVRVLKIKRREKIPEGAQRGDSPRVGARRLGSILVRREAGSESHARSASVLSLF